MTRKLSGKIKPLTFITKTIIFLGHKLLVVYYLGLHEEGHAIQVQFSYMPLKVQIGGRHHSLENS